MEPLTRVRPVGCSFSMLVPERHREVYEGAGYEAYSTVLFQASSAASEVVVDIGAHMGYYSLLARQANPTARVVAVEASPEKHEVLARNLESAGGAVVAINAAFGDAVGTVTLQLTAASDNRGIHGHPASPTIATVEVPAVTGADLAVPAGARLTVKIDVEGNEVQALDGLAAVLATCPDNRLFIEFNPKCLDRARSSPEALLGWLYEHDYRVFLLDEDDRRWAELRTPGEWTTHVEPLAYANLLCVPAARALTVGAVMHHAGSAGAERSHVELVEELVARGVMVHTVLPLPDDAGLGVALARAGSSLSAVQAYPWWSGPASHVQAKGPGWRAGLVDHGVVEALRGVRPDIVLTQTGVAPQGAVAAATLGIPHVWFLREFGDLDHGYTLPLPPRELGALIGSLSAAVVTNSAAVRDHFFGGPHDGVTVILPAPRLAGHVPAPSAPRPMTVGVVASLNPGKGHEDVLDAVAVLRAAGLEVPVVAAGSGELADDMRLRGAAERLGIADLFTLLGPVRDRAELYGLFDVVVVPSRAEAFGRVPFEATAAGLPVVYSDSGGPAEYMTPGVTGLSYPTGDTAALAAAIRTLAEDPSLRQRLVTGAREHLGDPSRRAAYGDGVLALLRAAAGRSANGPVQALTRWLAEAVDASDARAADAGRRLADAVENARSLEVRLQDLQAEHESTAEAFARLWRDRKTLAAEHERVNRAYAELWDDRERIRAALAAADDRLAAERSDLRAEVERLGADAKRLATEHRILQEEHARVLSSRAWRWTAPARRLRRALRRRA